MTAEPASGAGADAGVRPAAEASTPASMPPAGATVAAGVPHRWRNLLTLTGVTAVDSTEGSVTATLFPSIAAALGLDNGSLGLLGALGKAASVPAGPLFVWLAGRVGRRAALVASTSLGGLFGILAGFSSGFGWLLLLNALMAAAVNGGNPIANAVIADSFSDRERGRAAGILYGVTSTVGSARGPLLALLPGFSDGWRYAMWAIGAVCLLSGLVVATVYRDPGVGAAEEQLADLDEDARERQRRPVTVRSVLGLFRIPTYALMMASRLLSGHLLILVFGVQFLASERGFSNAVAAVVSLPFGLGYLAGTVGGGFLLGPVDRRWPDHGRAGYLQAAQVFFAVAAFFGTQFHYPGGIAPYCVFWALMGVGQGLNPPVNRPVVAAVVLPELRGQAFAVWLSVFETLGWGLLSILAGRLAASLGLQGVFLWVLVVMMLANAVLLGALHLTYRRDAHRVADALAERRRLARDPG
jgi:MFS family permease